MYSRTCCRSRETVIEGADCIYEYNTTLHCTALHCTTLHYPTLHYTTLHYTTVHFTTLNYTALHCTVLHCTALHCTALHCIVSYRTASRNTRNHIAIHNCSAQFHTTYQHFHPKISPCSLYQLIQTHKAMC
jgi:hypothetical protein